MKAETVIIDSKEFVIKKQLETVNNKLVAFLELDDEWFYGIKQNGKWAILNNSFPKLKMFREIKDKFIKNPTVSALEKVYDKLMGVDDYTKVLNLADLKYNGINSIDKFKDLSLETSSWENLVMTIFEIVLNKENGDDIKWQY